MNNMFSTLLVGLALTSSVGAFAADYVPAKGMVGKYEVGKAYLLYTGAVSGEGSAMLPSASTYLSVTGDRKEPKLEVVTLAETPGLADLQKALWEFEITPASVATNSPIYVLKNRYTGTVLSLDKNKVLLPKADGTYDEANVDNAMGGNSFEWLVRNPTVKPVKDNGFYFSYGKEDKVVVLAKKGTNATGEVYGRVIKAEELADNANIVTFTPFAANNTYYLTANDLNTQFGENGKQLNNNTGKVEATKDNFFQLDINKVVSEGQTNVFGGELQARAVQRWEMKYGHSADVEADRNSSVALLNAVMSDTDGDGIKTAEGNPFISMYPKANGSTYTQRTNPNNMTAYKSDESVFALYSKVENKYLVVDTAYIPGTAQVRNGLIDFDYDNLYNAKNEKTKYRLPESYLFRFKYDATNNQVTVETQGYVKTPAMGKKQQVKETTDDATFYEADYASAPVKMGSRWVNTDDYTTANDKKADAMSGVDSDGVTYSAPELVAAAANGSKPVYLTYANLVGTTVHTLAVLDKVEPDFSVKVGIQPIYQKRNLSGVYTFKVVGVANDYDRSRIGKYWVKTLGGNSEYVAQAARQNFQDMPAAQWVVKSTGVSTSYAPVSVNNREFGGEFKEGNSIPNGGYVYSAGENKIFFFGGDTLEIEAVKKANVDTLGYKYISEDEMKDAVYTFNYLHELAMDKPINTINDKDSAVWVDKDGSAMKFQLERVTEDTYGYNGDLKGVAQLKRLVYKIRVKDASKLENDRRYLAYDYNEKKYYVSTNSASRFFLKENNEVADGNCYYTLIEANVLDNVMRVKITSTDNAGVYIPSSIEEVADSYKAQLVMDNDAVASDGDKATERYYYAVATFENRKNQDGVDVKTWGVFGEDNPFYSAFNNNGSLVKIGSKYYFLYDYHYTSEDIQGVESYYYYYSTIQNETYASSKVSVDNESLALVNGVLDNYAGAEVAVSAFSVKKDDARIYRRLGDVEGEKLNSENVLNFFRTKSTEKEYLYEDANSKYSKGKGLNYLGVEGKGDAKNTAMYVKYTHGTRMPQYVIAVDTTVFAGTEYICPECGLTTCEHSKSEKAYIDGRFLVNLIDSVNYYSGSKVALAKYRYDEYTRLAFVDARLMGDSLIIKNSVYTGNTAQMNGLKDSTTWASKDTINLAPNKHNPALFSFRFFDDSNDFMIESQSWKDGNAFNGGIAPTEKGGWVKIHNGVPVIVNAPYSEAYEQAETFNLETTKEAPTANDAIDATTVSIIAGNGNVTIKNAEGKTVAISNILGQANANTVITSDNATIAVPAGIVIVSVEGEEAVKAIVK